METSKKCRAYKRLIQKISTIIEDEELTPYQIQISLYLLLGKDPEKLPGSLEWIRKQVRFLTRAHPVFCQVDKRGNRLFVNDNGSEADQNGVYAPNLEASLQENGVYAPKMEPTLRMSALSDPNVGSGISSRPRNPSKKHKKIHLRAQKVGNAPDSSVYMFSSNLVSLNKIRRDEKMSKKDMTPEQKKEELELIKKIVEDLNLVTGKKFKSKSEATREKIRARLREDYTFEDFQAVHRNQHAAWKGTRMEQYLRPETLYRPSHFESYLNNKGSAQIKTGMAETQSDAAGRQIRKDSPLVNPRVKSLKTTLEN